MNDREYQKAINVPYVLNAPRNPDNGQLEPGIEHIALSQLAILADIALQLTRHVNFESGNLGEDIDNAYKEIGDLKVLLIKAKGRMTHAVDCPVAIKEANCKIHFNADEVGGDPATYSDPVCNCPLGEIEKYLEESGKIKAEQPQ
jgi:hypothetical protein